jgi:hypothetical protein
MRNNATIANSNQKQLKIKILKTKKNNVAMIVVEQLNRGHHVVVVLKKV